VDVSKPGGAEPFETDGGIKTSRPLEIWRWLALMSAIAEAPEKTPTTLTSNSHITETVRVLGPERPANPKTLETFNRSPVFFPTAVTG